jgi:hypothetical protein
MVYVFWFWQDSPPMRKSNLGNGSMHVQCFRHMYLCPQQMQTPMNAVDYNDIEENG